MIDKPGKYNISFEEYLADPCVESSLSRSVIKDLIRCPAKAWFNHPRLNPDCPKEEASEKFDIGTAAHALFLQGINRAAVIDAADWRTNAAKEARDVARTEGKIPLLKHQYDAVLAMVSVAQRSLFNSELSIDIAADCESEVTYIWKEGETWCRARLDAITKNRAIIFDYKTSGGSADPEDYARIAIPNGLDIQDAFYRRPIEILHSVVPRFIFIVQETAAPHLCSFIELDPMTKDMGNRKVERGLEIWRQCRKNNHWPGYSSTVTRMEAKPWDLARWEITSNTTEVRTGDGIPF